MIGKKYLIITHETPTISILALVLLSPHSHYTSHPYTTLLALSTPLHFIDVLVYLFPHFHYTSQLQHHPLSTLNDSPSYFEMGERIIVEQKALDDHILRWVRNHCGKERIYWRDIR
jgi:hypothetical protein